MYVDRNRALCGRRNPPRLGRRPARTLACLAAVAMLSVSVTQGQQKPSPDPNRPLILPEANRLPDANQQMEMHNRQTAVQNYTAANAERRKQIAQDSAKILKLATALKAEIDKSDKADKDTLSASQFRKMDDIERLAHNIQEKMKLVVGPG